MRKKNRNISNINYINNTSYFKKSPITRMYILMNELKDIDNKLNLNFDYYKTSFKSMPSYTIFYPNNILFYINIENYNIDNETTLYDTFISRYTENYFDIDYDNDNNDSDNQLVLFKDDTLECFTDGSCDKNPGPAGCASICPKNELFNIKYSFDHETVINYAELMAIFIILEKLNNNKNNIDISNYLNIAIFTDSMFVFNILRKTGYPKLHYYYELIIKIFYLLNNLKSFKFKIIKVKAHPTNEYNNKVDLAAKEAMKIAKKWKKHQFDFNNIEYGNKWDNNKTPAIVSIAKQIDILKMKYNERRDSKWRNKIIEIINNKNIRKREQIEPKWPKNYLFAHSVWKLYINEKILDNNSKYFINEMKLLNSKQCEIINKLRTECINLNSFKKNINQHNTGKCDYCNDCYETVEHFIMDCPQFELIRDKFRRKLCKLNDFFKENIKWDIMNILFPHRWQIRPSTRDKNYKEKIKTNTQNRVKIILEIIKYVQLTKRFENEKY